MTSKDGGPAYPAEYDKHYTFNGEPLGTSGMTMRQAYKMAVTTGVVMASFTNESMASFMMDEGGGPEPLAEIIGKIADALLAEDEAHAEKDEG